jgi:hypothetical protein
MSEIPPKFRNPIYHFHGPSTFPSPYKLTDKALKDYGVSRELFGSTNVIISKDLVYNVKDYQYAVAKDDNGNVTAVGMNILPVSDNSFVLDPNGNPVAGSQMVDDLIREKSGLGPDDQIYALISYMHPECNSGTISELSKTAKTTLGFTHLGAYKGNGITSNSPTEYHNHRFGCKWGGVIDTDYGYPCNVHLIRLENVDQATFNRNCQLVDMLVGHGLEFPGNYQDSMFRPVYVNAALMYYRDWLYQEDYLMTDSSWYFYCAANKLTVLNIACNLPHNPNSFKEVYGEVEGTKLWQQFLKRYTNVTGFSFYYYPDQETDFTPLWKQEGLTPEDITPFTIDQYNAYDAFRREGTPYNGPSPVAPPKAVVCDAQSTADIVYEFVMIYADPYDAGPLTTIGVLFGFMQPVLQRTGIPETEYLYYALGISQKLAYEYACISAAANPAPAWDQSKWFWETYNIIFAIFGGSAAVSGSAEDIKEVQKIVDQGLQAQDLANTTDQPAAEVMTVYTLMDVILNWDKIMARGIVDAATAYDEFMESAHDLFEGAEGIVVTNPDMIQYNIMPSALNVVSNGLYGKNSLVSIETICTAVDMSELQLKKTQ